VGRVAVIGGSVCGLTTALTLARAGHDVTVYERDPAPPPDRADVLGWDRPGTPQLRHSHAFLGRAAALLRDDHPDLYADLLGSGAYVVRTAEHLPPSIDDRGPREDDDGLVVLSVRRPVFDWLLHAYAARAGVTVDRSGVAGLTFRDGDGDGAAVPHVTGLALADGRTVAADAVVDASGRRTRTPKWLATAGAVDCPESANECGNRYYTRYYALPPGAESPPLQRGFVSGGELDACLVLVFRGEDRTFSVSLQTEDGDPELRVLRDPRAFEALARLAPWAVPWLAEATPLNDPSVMAGQQNLLRRSVSGGVPVATGLLLAGDAIATSNPSFGRGVTLALVSAYLVRDALRVDDPEGQVRALDEAVLREMEPFVRNSQEVDARALARWRHRLYGMPEPPPPDGVTYEDVIAAAMTDRTVWQAFMHTVLLLRSPDTLLADPYVAERAAAAKAAAIPPPPSPVTRAEILAAVSAAVA
jgi:2-polyprenyl-6-methoxyphenol hydroxylase-like FAD-dependent oxidoreductase